MKKSDAALLRVIIIDDEEPARNLMRYYLATMPEIEIVAECADGFEALKCIQETRPDAIFLDIQMPKLTGFELLEVLTHRPGVVFTTAYDAFAIRAFENNAVDYLLKPFGRDRLVQAVEKLQQRKATPPVVADELERMQNWAGQMAAHPDAAHRLVVRTTGGIHLIPYHELMYAEADGDYVMLHTPGARHLKEATLKSLELRLDASQFVRIHRSRIVNIAYIKSIEPYEKERWLIQLKNGTKLHASAAGYRQLKQVLAI